MLNEKRKKEIRKITTKLVEEKSKSGEEKNAIKKVKFFMEKFNFDDIHIDKFGSLIGRINGTEKGKSILLDSHIDTVGADEKSWSRNPFKAVVENDRIYGRGTSDMKGALAAMIVASFSLSEDINFKGDIYVSCTVHEELFEGVAAREISKYINPDYVIIGEASNLNIMRGQRGRAEIVIETSGKSSHSANPEVGHNAVYDMVDLIKEIRNYKETNHEILGKGILELTDIMSSPYPGNSVIPNNCRSTYDRRLLVGETKDSVLKKIKKARQQDFSFQAGGGGTYGKVIF